MKKGATRSVLWVILSAPFVLQASCQTPSQPSLPPETEGYFCGDEDTQVTICFPGTKDEAQCDFAITNSSTRPASSQPCPETPLFASDCTTLSGLLLIAYGPCQNQISLQNTAVRFESPGNAPAPQQSSTTRPIPEWLDILGLQGIRQIGAFLVRGYAYQLSPLTSTMGVELLPELRKVGTVIPVALDNARLSPLTILGAMVPPLDYVTDLEGGMLIENTPNVNFTNLFGSLQTIKGTISIVGNSQLTSLDGLQGLALPDALGNLQILGNNRLVDITALDGVLNCTEDGSTGVYPPNSILGVIEVQPFNPKSSDARCLLTTAEQVCQFNANPQCPKGTESIAIGIQLALNASLLNPRP